MNYIVDHNSVLQFVWFSLFHVLGAGVAAEEEVRRQKGEQRSGAFHQPPGSSPGVWNQKKTCYFFLLKIFYNYVVVKK